MSDIRDALVAYLSSLPGITEAVGNRISPLRHRAREVLPRLCYRVRSHTRVRDSEGPCGQATARFEIEVFDGKYQRAVEIAWLIVGRKGDQRLDGFQGTWADTYQIDSAVVEEWEDEHDERADGSDEVIYRQRLEVLVTYQEPVEGEGE